MLRRGRPSRASKIDTWLRGILSGRSMPARRLTTAMRPPWGERVTVNGSRPAGAIGAAAQSSTSGLNFIVFGVVVSVDISELSTG